MIEAWAARAEALDVLGRADEAIAACRQAVRLAPTDYDVWQALGWACGVLGRHSEAQAAYLRAVELIQEQTGERSILLAQPYRALSWWEQQEGRMGPAIEYARLATEVNPNNAAGWGQLAAALGSSGKMADARAPAEEAVRRASRGLAQHPDDVGMLRTMAYAQYALVQPEQAVRYYRRIHEIDPRNVLALRALAEALGRLNTPAALKEARALLDEIDRAVVPPMPRARF